MRLLITNDDGIHSPGLAALAKAATDFGEVRVVAPDVERSSTGHAITAAHPLSYRPTRVGNLSAWRVNGTPADCVALGLHQWEGVDAVLSGLNLGLNLGNAVWHSGTLAAAKQAALFGVRGIALSAPSALESDFSSVVPWVSRVLQTLLRETPPVPLVNVNLPRDPRGLLWTRASTQGYDGRIVPGRDPMGREIYWFTVVPIASSDDRSESLGGGAAVGLDDPAHARRHRRRGAGPAARCPPARRGGGRAGLADGVVERRSGLGARRRSARRRHQPARARGR